MPNFLTTIMAQGNFGYHMYPYLLSVRITVVYTCCLSGFSERTKEQPFGILDMF